jgi:hypothetical protein
MTSKEMHTLTTIRKLIDLNKEMVNFTVSFRVASKNALPFQGIVVTQDLIDEGKYEFRDSVNGEFTGTVSNETNTFTPHFLVLRAEKPVECEVTISRQELPMKIEQTPVVKQQPILIPAHPETNWIRTILIVGILCLAGYLVYDWMNTKKENISLPNITLPSQPGSKFAQRLKNLELI